MFHLSKNLCGRSGTAWDGVVITVDAIAGAGSPEELRLDEEFFAATTTDGNPTAVSEETEAKTGSADDAEGLGASGGAD